VETAYLVQDYCGTSYFINGSDQEKALAARIDTLWKEVDWNGLQKVANLLFTGTGHLIWLADE